MRRLGTLLLAFALCAPASAQDDLELKVKAAFLFNFAKFVTWPPAKFASPQSPIELCVMEPDPLRDVLADTVAGKQIGGRPLAVRGVAYNEDLGNCHLLYAGQRNPAAAAALFSRIGGQGMMTVHDAAEPVPGGVARLYLEERKVRIEINTAAVDREQLQLSSKLLSVASVVSR